VLAQVEPLDDRLHVLLGRPAQHDLFAARQPPALALPPAVAFLVYITSPQYIELLWTHPTGRMLLAGCAVWMFTGVIVMRKMIHFDF
jgi:hypothetical protein